MPDAVESVGQDMHQEASDELRCGQAHNLLAITILDPVILPAKRHRVGVGVDEALVGDRYSMGVTAEIGEHGFRPVERRFGIHHPFGFAERGQPCREGIRPRQVLQITKEGQFSSLV